jgi:hypothetical protein
MIELSIPRRSRWALLPQITQIITDQKDNLPRINANKHESKICCVAPLGLLFYLLATHPSGFAALAFRVG